MLYSRKDRKDTRQTETLKTHAEVVARLCEEDCAKLGVPALGRLLQRYLFEEEREKMPHAPAGAKLLYDLAREPEDNMEKLAAQIASLAS